MFITDKEFHLLCLTVQCILNTSTMLISLDNHAIFIETNTFCILRPYYLLLKNNACVRNSLPMNPTRHVIWLFIIFRVNKGQSTFKRVNLVETVFNQICAIIWPPIFLHFTVFIFKSDILQIWILRASFVTSLASFTMRHATGLLSLFKDTTVYSEIKRLK